jgi:hypothetical protein
VERNTLQRRPDAVALHSGNVLGFDRWNYRAGSRAEPLAMAAAAGSAPVWVLPVRCGSRKFFSLAGAAQYAQVRIERGLHSPTTAPVVRKQVSLITIDWGGGGVVLGAWRARCAFNILGRSTPR